MASNGDLWEHLADEVKEMRADVRKLYDRVGSVGRVLGKVATATRKRFDAQQAQLKAHEQRIRQLERRLAD